MSEVFNKSVTEKEKKNQESLGLTTEPKHWTDTDFREHK